MTGVEYIQMKAFARYDGLKLFVLWLASFACYVAGFRTPGLGLVAMVLALLTPFMAYRMLRRYREDVLGGAISFRRGWFYVVLLFLNAGLLFAVAQFVYFNYMDQGYFMSAMTEMLNTPESAAAMKQMGMGATLNQTLDMMRQMRPIDLVLNILMSNLLIGCLVALLLAALGKRDVGEVMSGK